MIIVGPALLIRSSLVAGGNRLPHARPDPAHYGPTDRSPAPFAVRGNYVEEKAGTAIRKGRRRHRPAAALAGLPSISRAIRPGQSIDGAYAVPLEKRDTNRLWRARGSCKNTLQQANSDGLFFRVTKGWLHRDGRRKPILQPDEIEVANMEAHLVAIQRQGSQQRMERR